MKTDETTNSAQTSNPATDRNSSDLAKEPVYKTLGESGLVEDEDGDIFDIAEIFGDDPPKSVWPNNVPAGFKKSSFVSALDDKSNPAHWFYYYDERYCGPDRQAWMEKMALKHRQEKVDAPAKSTKESTPPVAKPKKESAPPVAKPKKESPPPVTKPKKESAPPVAKPPTAEPTKENVKAVSSEANQKADQEQKALERDGLRPLWRQFTSGQFFVGIVNSNNEVVITNKEYSLIGIFSNGLAIARSKKTKLFGFVDRHGNEVIPCKWHSVGPFSEYMAGVHNEYKRCGYVDVTGRLVIPCTWVEGWPFREGLARVQSEYRKIGMIDKRGKNVIPCIWKKMSDCSEGLIGVQDDSGKCGFIDKSGKVVIPCRWKQVWIFCEGMAVVQDFNKRLGFIDKSGELVIPCRWKKVNFFKDGLAKVSDSKRFFFRDKWVYIDKQGRIVK